MFGNFAAMGLNFGNMKLTSDAIEKKLNDPNTTVEDLLREEDLLQEFRSQNEKLIEYFDKDKIKRLLDYIIKEPEVDEQERGYKFPFLCSQIFGLELDKIMEPFFKTNKEFEEENKKKEESNDVNKEKEEKKDNNNKNNENPEKALENKEKEKEDNKKEDNGNENKNKDEEKKEQEQSEKKEESKKNEENKEKDKKNDKNEEGNKKEVEKEKEGESKTQENAKKDEDKKEGEKKEDKKEVEKKEGEKKEEEKKEGEKKEEDKKEEEEKKEGEGDEEGGEEEEKEEPESKENRIELLDHFFSFFPEDDNKQLNYVLSGYFSSLIINLLSIKPTDLLKYVYLVRSDVLYKMVDHCYRKSISDTLSKLLHFENYFQSEDSLDEKTREDMNDTRKLILADIFQKININMENENLNSIYFLITGLFEPTNIFEEKQIFQNLIEEKRCMRALITKPFNELDLTKTENNFEKKNNERKNFMVIIDIIIFLLNNIKKLKLDIPKDGGSKLLINHSPISQEIFDNLGNLIKNNFNKKNEENDTYLQSFNAYQLKPLGEYKIKIIDLLVHLVPYFKDISKYFDEILIETEFFKNAFDYLFEYEWNNIYQESLLSLLKSLINDADHHQLVQEYLFNTFKIVEIIKSHTNLEDKFKFNNEISTPITHGYYSFFISLSYKINTALGGTPIVIKNNYARQGSFCFLAKVPEDGDKKAAMNLLYGGFDDEEAENEKEKEEEKFSYETMGKYLNDDWRSYFGLNIENVIKQYDNKDWPEQKKDKSSFDSSPFQRAEDNTDLLNENEGMSKRDKNIFGDDDDNDDNKNDINGRRGVTDQEVDTANLINDNKNENEDNPFKGNDVNLDTFEFDDDNKNENKEKEKKDEENPFKNNDINTNDFEFEDNKEENNKKNNENKNEGNEGKKEDIRKEDPKKEDPKKEEPKKEEPKKEEPKKEEPKTEEPKKEETKNEEVKNEEQKQK